jgi:hypothetical protein
MLSVRTAFVARRRAASRYRFKCVLTKQGLPPEGVGGIYVFVRRRWAFFLEAALCRQGRRPALAPDGPREMGPRAYWYYGATERYVLGPIRDEVDRRRVEEDLIRGLKPRMNDMEIPAGRGRQNQSAKPPPPMRLTSRRF